MARVAGHFRVSSWALVLHHKSHAAHRLLFLPAQYIGPIREVVHRNLTRRHHGFYLLPEEVPNVYRSRGFRRQVEYIIGRIGHGMDPSRGSRVP